MKYHTKKKDGEIQESCRLTPKEIKVIVLRNALLKDEFGGHKTLEEVGKVFGVTRERIRQIEAKAIEKIRVTIL